jgi:hypothetical protein
MSRACEVCGQPISGRKSSARRCGRIACERSWRAQYMRRARGPKLCRYCGESFPRSRRGAVYCSAACALSAQADLQLAYYHRLVSDPTGRARRLATARLSYHAHADVINARRRQRRAEDPEATARANARRRQRAQEVATRERMREQARQSRRRRALRDLARALIDRLNTTET